MTSNARGRRRGGWLGLGLALCAVPVTGAVSQLPRFTSGVRAVRVDVLVTQQGKPVSDLGQHDFEVLDNGVRQKVDLTTSERIPVHVVLALDLSQSLADDALAKLRAAGRLAIDALRPGDRGAVLTFSNAVTARTTLTGRFDLLRNALDQSPQSGETSLIDGVYAAMAIAESDADGRGLVIVFSDGEDTSSFLQPDAVLKTARGMDVVVYAVSMGRSVPAPFLADLAELTSGRRLQVSSPDGLGVTFTQILEEFRWRHLLSFTPTGVAADGWHRLEVRVRRPGITVRARSGYFVTGPGAR